MEHFFLYNHHSATVHHERLLAPYIDAGLVTLGEAVCDVHCQVPTYAHLFEHHAAKTRWLALIDIDEFLMPSPSEIPGPRATVAELLPAYEQFGGVVVHWLVFGSSHHEVTPAGLVVENYLWRAAEVHEVFKTVAQAHKVAVVGGHNHQYRYGDTAVNDVMVPIAFNPSVGEAASSHSPASAAVLRLHHYRTKSRAHALWRFERDATFRLNDFDNEDIYPSSPESQEGWLLKWDANHVQDETAMGYLACVRQGLAQRAAAATS